MERRVVSTQPILLSIALLLVLASSSSSSEAADSKGSFQENFDLTCPDDHFTTSVDRQIWYLSLDKEAGKHKQHLTRRRKNVFLSTLLILIGM